MKPKIEIREINRVTVGVFVGDEERARFTGKDRQEQAETFERELRESMNPKGGLWDLRGGAKVVVENKDKSKCVGVVSVDCNSEKYVYVKIGGWSNEIFIAKTGRLRGGMSDRRIYINDAEVAQIEAEEADKRIADDAESLKRAHERAADARTPLLDRFFEQPPAFQKCTLEQLKLIEEWTR